MFLYGALAYGLTVLSMYARTGRPVAFLNTGLVPSTLLTLALGFITFALGYAMFPIQGLFGVQGRRPTWPGQNSPPEVMRSPVAIFLVYMIGLVATLLKTHIEGGFGYLGGTTITSTAATSGLSQPLGVLVFFRLAAVVAISARFALQRRKADRNLMFALGAVEVVLGLLSAQKEPFVVAVLALALPLMMSTRRLPGGRLVAAVAVFVLVVTPVVTSVRTNVRTSTGRLDTSSAFAVSAHQLSHPTEIITGAGGGWAAFVQISARVRSIDSVILIRQQTPGVFPYEPAQNIVAAPVTGLVPRAFWPSKPVRVTGLDFFKTYYHGLGFNSAAVTMQGSWLLHGGLPVLLVGMLLLGVAVRAVDDFAATRGLVHASILVVMLFVPIVKQETPIEDLLAAVPLYVVTYLVSCACLTTSDRSLRRRWRRATIPS